MTFPEGASSWWNLPKNQLTAEQLDLRRKYNRENRTKHRQDPVKLKRDQETSRRHVVRNKKRVYARNAAWRKAHWAQVLESRRKPNYRVASVLRSRICKAVRSQKAIKSARLLGLLGCNLTQLRDHLERQFRPDMSWANYGPVWHIDHEKPCASFDLKDPAQQAICFNFKNLQPLFAFENLQKGASMVG